jgi:DNA modification methylase
MTYEGDVVLDPFIGSGTTAVAAKKTGRHYIGFEISEDYCDIARKRVEETVVEQN